MKRILVIIALFSGSIIGNTLCAQDFGLSFSYFIPRNGYFSTPVSPFSIRGVGFDINRYLAVETGASLYRMSGLNVKDIMIDGVKVESKSPMVGPNFTLFVPVELVLQLKGQGLEFDIKGGGFFFYGFGQKLNYGNIDRTLRDFENWQVANADLSFKNKPGFGYHAGAELTVPVTGQVSVSVECNYLVGQSGLPLTGTYTGGNNGNIETKQADFQDAKVDFTGLEFSIGLIFSGGGGQGQKAKRRR